MFDLLRTKLVQNAALILRPSAHFLPKPLQEKTMLLGLQTVFKESLEDGDFEFLDGKCLKVEVTDVHLDWYISYQEGTLVVNRDADFYDVSFSGKLNDLVLIAGRKEDPDTLFFQRRLKIEGDTELGLEVKNLMDSVDLDALPKPLNTLLNQLSGFVQKGLQYAPEDKELMNVDSN